MKALVNYQGFTKMVDVSGMRDIYEECIDTRGLAYQEMMRNSQYQHIYMNSIQRGYKYLIFKKVGETEVDGEQIAVFEYYEER